MRTIRYVISSVILATTLGLSQEAKVVETSFKVFGNCNMCKNRIEKAVKIKEVDKASWNKQTKMLTVSYRPSAISVDSLQKRIAAVGHDTPKFAAADSVYDGLPGCCLYRDNDSTH